MISSRDDKWSLYSNASTGVSKQTAVLPKMHSTSLLVCLVSWLCVWMMEEFKEKHQVFIEPLLANKHTGFRPCRLQNVDWQKDGSIKHGVLMQRNET